MVLFKRRQGSKTDRDSSMTRTSDLEPGPLEQEVIGIFRDMWERSPLRPSVTPSIFELTTALLDHMGQVERAIRRVAAAVDQANL